MCLENEYTAKGQVGLHITHIHGCFWVLRLPMIGPDGGSEASFALEWDYVVSDTCPFGLTIFCVRFSPVAGKTWGSTGCPTGYRIRP
jgi:hypothetical protein